MEYQPTTKAQYLVVYILDQLVGKLSDSATLVPQNNVGEQVKYPFVTYNMVTPHIETTYDHRADQLITTMQIDCHDSDQFKALDLAEKLHDAIYSNDGYRRFFTQANVVPQTPDSSSNVDNHTSMLYGTNYDFTFGFDVDFLISHADDVVDVKDLNFDYSDDVIESVKAGDDVTDGSVNVSK